MTEQSFKPVRIMLDERKLARLRAVAEERGVALSELVREGIDRVLTLAETQMRTIENAVKGSTPGG